MAGIERRALKLLGAPRARRRVPGHGRDRPQLEGRLSRHAVDARRSPRTTPCSHRAAQQLLAAPPEQAAHRIAWLREQAIQRLGMTEFRNLVSELDRANLANAAVAGADSADDAMERPSRGTRGSAGSDSRRRDRRHASAVPRPVPPPTVARRRSRGACCVSAARPISYAGSDISAPSRGFPEVADELAVDVEHFTPALRYEALVGLTLARPADLVIQRRLLVQRRELATSGFPPL